MKFKLVWLVLAAAIIWPRAHGSAAEMPAQVVLSTYQRQYELTFESDWDPTFSLWMYHWLDFDYFAATWHWQESYIPGWEVWEWQSWPCPDLVDRCWVSASRHGFSS